MDSFNSVSVLLEPPKPNPDGRIIRMKTVDFLNLMSDFRMISPVGKATKATAIEYSDKSLYEWITSSGTQTEINQRNSATDPIQWPMNNIQTQTKRRVRDFACNVKIACTHVSTDTSGLVKGIDACCGTQTVKLVDCSVNTAPVKRSGIALPFQRTSTAVGVPTASSKPLSRKGNKISLDMYKEKRKLSSDIEKHHVSTQTDESLSLSEIQNEMKHVHSHLKRLKNLIRAIFDNQPTNLIRFAGRYLDHVTKLTKKFRDEDPLLVIREDNLKVQADFEENPLWILTKNPFGKLPKGASDQTENDIKKSKPKRSKSVSASVASNTDISSDEDRRSSAKRRRLEVEKRKSKAAKRSGNTARHARTPPPSSNDDTPPRRSKSRSKSMHRLSSHSKSPKRRCSSPSPHSRKSRRSGSPVKRSRPLKRRLSRSPDESSTRQYKHHEKVEEVRISKPNNCYKESTPTNKSPRDKESTPTNKSPREQYPGKSNSRKDNVKQMESLSQSRDPRLRRKSFESVGNRERIDPSRDTTVPKKDSDYRKMLAKPTLSKSTSLETCASRGDTTTPKLNPKSADLREKLQIPKEKNLKLSHSQKPANKGFCDGPEFTKAQNFLTLGPWLKNIRKMSSESEESLLVHCGDASVVPKQSQKPKALSPAEGAKTGVDLRFSDPHRTVKKPPLVPEPKSASASVHPKQPVINQGASASVWKSVQEIGTANLTSKGSRTNPQKTCLASRSAPALNGSKKDNAPLVQPAKPANQSKNLPNATQKKSSTLLMPQSILEGQQKSKLSPTPQPSNVQKDLKQTANAQAVLVTKSQQMTTEPLVSEARHLGKQTPHEKNDSTTKIRQMPVVNTKLDKLGRPGTPNLLDDAVMDCDTSSPAKQTSAVPGIKKGETVIPDSRGGVPASVVTSSSASVQGTPIPTVRPPVPKSNEQKVVEKSSTGAPDLIDISAIKKEVYTSANPALSSPEVKQQALPKSASPSKVYPKASSLISSTTQDSNQGGKSAGVENLPSSEKDHEKETAAAERKDASAAKNLPKPVEGSAVNTSTQQREKNASSPTKSLPQRNATQISPVTAPKNSESPSSAKQWQGNPKWRKSNQYSRISTQITQRNDYRWHSDYPYPHSVGEGMVNCRSTPNYYPPRLQHPNPGARRQFRAYGPRFYTGQFYNHPGY